MNADEALEVARKAYPNDEDLRVAYMLGLNEGYELHKEQMMKEAKEVTVRTTPLNGPLGIMAYCSNFPYDHPFYNCKEGDKVKLIIVKD